MFSNLEHTKTLFPPGKGVTLPLHNNISGNAMLSNRKEIDDLRRQLNGISGVLSAQVYTEKIVLLERRDVLHSLLSGGIVILSIFTAIFFLQESDISILFTLLIGVSISVGTEMLIIIKNRLSIMHS